MPGGRLSSRTGRYSMPKATAHTRSNSGARSRSQRRLVKVQDAADVHSELVRRAALLERLWGERAAPVVTVFAPAGYGKSTLLAQVAESDERPVALVSLEEVDNDP